MFTPADRSYTNAAREGRTHPGMIEMIEANDPRLPQNKRVVTNRADRRRNGNYKGRPISKSPRVTGSLLKK